MLCFLLNTESSSRAPGGYDGQQQWCVLLAVMLVGVGFVVFS